MGASHNCECHHWDRLAIILPGVCHPSMYKGFWSVYKYIVLTTTAIFRLPLYICKGKNLNACPEVLICLQQQKIHIWIGHKMQIWLQTYFVNLFVVHFKNNFHQIGPLGQFGLVVAMSVCLSVSCPLERVFKRGCSPHFCVYRVRFLVRIGGLK